MQDDSIEREDGGGGIWWCASGALSPDYYQLLMEECVPDSLTSVSSTRLLQQQQQQQQNDVSNPVIARMEQMDQLWSMDSLGYIHSIFDYERCMMIPSSSVDGADANAVNEVPVEIGPCDDTTALNQFYYDDSMSSSSSVPNVLKLQGYDTLCVTFLGGEVATKGSPMILGQCDDDDVTQDKYGWDFVRESDLDDNNNGPRPPTPPSSLPTLRYLGRDACGANSQCQACSGDCDVDTDCENGLQCFERARDDSTQVPGCDVGGPGDIPGADYCYDPTFVNGGGPPPSPPAAPSEPQSLIWLGSTGCSADNPCPPCTGDCDDDSSCSEGGSCFKRLVGETTQIPGCSVGGSGDVPGGDYCYDPSEADAEGPTAPINPGMSRPLPPPSSSSRPVPPPLPSQPIPQPRPDPVSPPQPNPVEPSPSVSPGSGPSPSSDTPQYPTYSPSTPSTLPEPTGPNNNNMAAPSETEEIDHTWVDAPVGGGSNTVSPTTPSSKSSESPKFNTAPGTKSSKAAYTTTSTSNYISTERQREHASTRSERQHNIEVELLDEEAEEIEEYFEEQTRDSSTTHAERENQQ